MKNLEKPGGRELIWSQPTPSKREFELHYGSDLVATLKWQRQFGSLAIGECADGVWTFKRAGFLRPKVMIRRSGTETELAQYEAGWAGSGQVLFADGRGYYWRQRSFWHHVWAFENETGEIVTQFRNDLHVFNQKVQLTLLDVGRAGADRPLLSILGLYLMILSDQDSTTAATAAIMS